MVADRWRGIAVPTALVAATAATRLPNLGRPRILVFDEVYYALDAADLLQQGVEQGPVVHPPLGKWLIATGIRVAGFTPTGWRLALLVAGCLTVLVTYVAARQLVAGRGLAALAAGLVALDGIAFTTGRVALLDGFVALFVTVSVACTLAAYRRRDDDRMLARLRLAAGGALGLALATKWTAAPVLVAIAAVFAVLASSRRAAGLAAGAVVAAAVGVYLVAYVPWLVNAGRTAEGIGRCGGRPCALSLPERAAALVDDQARMFDFHRRLRPTNRYAAPGWTWATQTAPVVLYGKTCVAALREAPDPVDDGACAGAAVGDEVRMVTIGNPVVWWAALASGGHLAWRALRRRDRACLFLVGIGAALWLPWLAPGRHPFLYYAAPLVPVLALWVTAASDRLPAPKWAAPAVAGLALAAFVWLYPVWAGLPLSPDALDARQFWDWL